MVTGAASGIGLAIAKRLLAEGAKVVGSDLRRIDDLGAGFVGLEGDVTSEASAEQLVATAVERFGGLHAAFNVAGPILAAANTPIKPSNTFIPCLYPRS